MANQPTYTPPYTLVPKHITQKIIEHELANTPWPWNNDYIIIEPDGTTTDGTNNIYYSQLAPQHTNIPTLANTTLTIRTTHPTTKETRHTDITRYPTQEIITITQTTGTLITSTTHNPQDPNFNLQEITQQIINWHTYTKE